MSGGGGLIDYIVERRPFVSDGNSGNPIEYVRLQDGRHLLLKRMSPAWDWMARESNDDGRIGVLWEAGILDRVPAVIDHTIVGVEFDGEAWNVFMRDRTDCLTPHHQRFDRAGVRRILGVAAEFHAAFWGQPFPELCGLVDRFSLFSPATGRRELAAGSGHGVVFTTGWDAFFTAVPRATAEAVEAVLDWPALLAERLHRYETTLIHGDLRLGNIGFDGGRMVLLDWGERVGVAPPAVELGWFLGFDATRFDVTKDEVVEDFRQLYGERVEEESLRLSLLGSLVQIGGLLGFWMTQAGDAGRATWAEELDWWAAAADRALEVWSPV